MKPQHIIFAAAALVAIGLFAYGGINQETLQQWLETIFGQATAE